MQMVTFKPIAGFPGYRVGDDGSVWSCWKKVSLGRGGTRSVMGTEWHRRKLSPSGERGYLKVMLATPEGKKSQLVARLVLEAFGDPCPPGGWVNYEDGNPANVAASNLSWKTRETAKASEVSRGTRNRGIRNGQAVLSEDAVREIRDEYAGGGVSQASVAARHGVCHTTVSVIVRRKYWKHL